MSRTFPESLSYKTCDPYAHNKIEITITFNANYSRAISVTSAVFYDKPNNKTPTIAVSHRGEHIFSAPGKISEVTLIYSFAELIFTVNRVSATRTLRENRDYALHVTKLDDTINDDLIIAKLTSILVKDYNMLDYVNYVFISELKDQEFDDNYKKPVIPDEEKNKLDFYLNKAARVTQKRLKILEPAILSAMILQEGGVKL